MNNSLNCPLVLAAAAVLLAACGKEKAVTAAPPPPVVIVAPVTQRTIPVYVENVAQTEAAQTVEIRARVEGFLAAAPFKEGGLVKKDDLLFQIDPKPYQAAVDQAQANVSRAEAAVARAAADVDRLKPLAQRNAISQQDLDSAVAAAKIADADLLAAKAALTNAQLNLGYTEMRAPFDGMIGSRLVDVGNYVGSSSAPTLLATVSMTDPIRAVFNVAESNFLRFQRRFMGDEAAREKHSESMVFQLLLSDHSVYEHTGKFDFAERTLDAKAGTLKVVVTFPNPELLLRPGQFARVRAKPDERPNAILVPQRAVILTQSAQSVLVVGADGKVTARPIKTEGRYEDLAIVAEGLKPGEKVVVDGVQKARPGMAVTAREAEPPAADAATPAAQAH